ncbi:MAG TPA: leucyl aminopeptidase [Acidobacteriaceae bacterium]|jgi:leucyl aminopeptidase|nr:leucyl aminopeptidase [Acidobacteriaceae bacterium]
MKTNLVSAQSSDVVSELLAVFVVDAAPKGAVTPVVRLLSDDSAVGRAAETVLSSGEFKAEANETVLLHQPAGLKAKRLLLVGLGKLAKLTPHEVRKGAGTAVRFAKPRGLRELAIVVPVSDGLDPQLAVRAVAEGAILGDFDSDTYRSERKDRSVQSVQVVVAEADRAAAEAGLREGTILAESQNFARTLVNEPGNRLTPTILGERAAEMCREFGIECRVHGVETLRELKMGAFLSVTQGSDEPPALIVMMYEPKGAASGPVLGLVGKGITFDTGGISIKPADSMEKMKYDMAGGAAMIGAMQAIAQLELPVKVIGIVCAAENMPSGKAQKPGDVQIAMPATGKPGKAIEIINTDAEGRLVLADGVTYAKQLGATHLIDAATLTGAVGVALGMINGGVFSNDEETYQRFAEGLKVSGERFWRLPVEDDYRELIRSSIADIKNTGGRYGGAITAAMFIKEFVEETPWIHLDIAGVAWIDDAKPWMASGPTGAAVRSIVEWARSYGSQRSAVG